LIFVDVRLDGTKENELRVMLMGLKRFTKTDPFNVKEARQLIATKIIDANEYCY